MSKAASVNRDPICELRDEGVKRRSEKLQKSKKGGRRVASGAEGDQNSYRRLREGLVDAKTIVTHTFGFDQTREIMEGIIDET